MAEEGWEGEAAGRVGAGEVKGGEGELERSAQEVYICGETRGGRRGREGVRGKSWVGRRRNGRWAAGEGLRPGLVGDNWPFVWTEAYMATGQGGRRSLALGIHVLQMKVSEGTQVFPQVWGRVMCLTASLLQGHLCLWGEMFVLFSKIWLLRCQTLRGVRS